MPSPEGKPLAGLTVLRDAGGVGDLIRIFAIIDRLCTRGPVTWVIPATYARLCSLCPAVASGACDLRPVRIPQHRKRSPSGSMAKQWAQVSDTYLGAAGSGEPHSPVIDLFCPALKHEIATGAHPTMDRVECWAREAECWPMQYPCVRLEPSPEERAWADSWWSDSGLEPARTIAVSAASVRGIRTWRNAPQAGHSRAGRIGLLVVQLRRMGWKVLVLDHADGCRSLGADAVSVDPDHPRQIAVMQRCRGYIGPDSGFLHAALAAGMRAVGLFGPTDGRLVLAPYPRSRVLILQGEHGPKTMRAYGCARPCYGMSAGGYRADRCGGICGVLEGLTEVMIAEAADRFFRSPDEANSPKSLSVRRMGFPDAGGPSRDVHHGC